MQSNATNIIIMINNIVHYPLHSSSSTTSTLSSWFSRSADCWTVPDYCWPCCCTCRPTDCPFLSCCCGSPWAVCCAADCQPDCKIPRTCHRQEDHCASDSDAWPEWPCWVYDSDGPFCSIRIGNWIQWIQYTWYSGCVGQSGHAGQQGEYGEFQAIAAVACARSLLGGEMFGETKKSRKRLWISKLYLQFSLIDLTLYYWVTSLWYLVSSLTHLLRNVFGNILRKIWLLRRLGWLCFDRGHCERLLYPSASIYIHCWIMRSPRVSQVEKQNTLPGQPDRCLCAYANLDRSDRFENNRKSH